MKPYKEEKTNRLRIINESLFTLGTFIMGFFPFFEDEEYELLYNILDYLCTGCFLAATIIELGTLGITRIHIKIKKLYLEKRIYKL